MTHAEIIKKLIGPIKPVGETNEDERRLENLHEMCGLVEELMDEIKYVSQYSTRVEFSLKAAGKKAQDFIDIVKFNY